jgi:hypothetical protein
MEAEDLERLTRVYKPGDRVVAFCEIHYAQHPELVIAEGTGGTVDIVSRANVPLVVWDGCAPGLGIPTSPDSLEPEAHGRRRSS